MLRVTFLIMALSSTFFMFSCEDPQLPDVSPCDEAFAFNRKVDVTTATKPYMKTCGISLRTSKFLHDVYGKNQSADQAYIDTIYDELEITDRIFKENNIPYAIEGGTLLGAIRNGGLIPSDDDADIAMDIQYEEKLKGLSNRFDKEGYDLEDAPFLGYKVKKKNTNSNGLDIFVIKVRTINGKDIFAYARDDAHATWPKALFPIAAMSNLVRIPFGHLQLQAMPLADNLALFEGYFGSDWYTVTYKDFDHVNRKSITPVKMNLLPTEYYHLVHSKSIKGN